MSATPNWPTTPRTEGVQLANGDGTSAKDFFTAGASSTRVDMIGVSSDDTSARDVQFILNDGTNDRLNWTLSIPINAGSIAATKGINALSRTHCPWLSKDGALIVKAGWKLRIRALVAVTAGKFINATMMGGDW